MFSAFVVPAQSSPWGSSRDPAPANLLRFPTDTLAGGGGGQAGRWWRRPAWGPSRGWLRAGAEGVQWLRLQLRPRLGSESGWRRESFANFRASFHFRRRPQTWASSKRSDRAPEQMCREDGGRQASFLLLRRRRPIPPSGHFPLVQPRARQGERGEPGDGPEMGPFRRSGANKVSAGPRLRDRPQARAGPTSWPTSIMSSAHRQSGRRRRLINGPRSRLAARNSRRRRSKIELEPPAGRLDFHFIAQVALS